MLSALALLWLLLPAPARAAEIGYAAGKGVELQPGRPARAAPVAPPALLAPASATHGGPADGWLALAPGTAPSPGPRFDRTSAHPALDRRDDSHFRRAGRARLSRLRAAALAALHVPRALAAARLGARGLTSTLPPPLHG